MCVYMCLCARAKSMINVCCGEGIRWWLFPPVLLPFLISFLSAGRVCRLIKTSERLPVYTGRCCMHLRIATVVYLSRWPSNFRGQAGRDRFMDRSWCWLVKVGSSSMEGAVMNPWFPTYLHVRIRRQSRNSKRRWILTSLTRRKEKTIDS